MFFKGRDKKFRPVIYMYPTRFQTSDMEDFEKFLKVYLGIIQKYCFKPYYIENWIIVIDLEHKGITNFPYKAIKAAIDATNVDYAARLHKMFILNPSFLFNATWNLVKGFIDVETGKKISFLKKKDFHLIQEHISKDQLLSEYGGNLDTPDAAYPIINTLEPNATPELLGEDRTSDNLLKVHNQNYMKGRKNTGVRYRSKDDMNEGSDHFHVESRSMKLINQESDFHKEMTMKLSYSSTSKSLYR